MKIYRIVSLYNMQIKNYKNIMKFRFLYKYNVLKYFIVLMLKIKVCVIKF